MSEVEKLCPVLLRPTATGSDILLFRRPQAGVQLVKGTREASEPIEAGALRELAEESGITSAVVTHRLGSSVDIMAGQLWHFVLVEAHGLPDSWAFDTADDGGHRFEFFWWPLAKAPDADWHPAFIRALCYLRACLN